MTKWEFYWINVPLYGDGEVAGQYDLEVLDMAGADGWEPYAHSEYARHMIVHLKRPKLEVNLDDEDGLPRGSDFIG